MRILLGVEGPESSQNAFQAIIAQFRPEGTEIRVLHVLKPIAFLTPPEMAEGYYPELEGQKEPARELVEQTANKLRKAGFKVETTIKIGDPSDVIIDSAAKWRADLIVLGSHGQRGIQSFLLGSVAESVARNAACSVEIVRNPQCD